MSCYVARSAFALRRHVGHAVHRRFSHALPLRCTPAVLSQEHRDSDADAAAAAAAASRQVDEELLEDQPLNPVHFKDRGLVAGVMQLGGEEVIQSHPHEESRRELARYYEAQKVARAQPLPKPSGTSDDAIRSQAPPGSSATDQLVLADARDDSDLVAETDLAALLRLHKEDPETWDAAALSARFGVDPDMLAPVLDAVTIPMLVKLDNETYGVWEVRD